VAEYTEVVGRAFDAFNERDMDRLVAFCHPEVEWTPPPELPGSRTYHGRDGVREAIGDMLGVFSDLRAEPVRIEQRAESVVGLYIWRGSADGSGASLDPFEVKAGSFAEFEDGLVRRIRFWTNWESALEAAGLAA
jgi:ketosteroid isomerase-like protein